jgi:hypothetical protein
MRSLRRSDARPAWCSAEVRYYCPSKNRLEVRHYDYTPMNGLKKIDCDGTYSGPQYPPPKTGAQNGAQTWLTIDDPKVQPSSCKRKEPPEFVTQWVAGPVYWELQTWEIYDCRDESGNQVERLFRTPT